MFANFLSHPANPTSPADMLTPAIRQFQ